MEDGSNSTHVLRTEELEAVASRMGQLGGKLAQRGATAEAVAPLRVAWLAARALLRRCDGLQVDRQVSRSVDRIRKILLDCHRNLQRVQPLCP
jgi:hypothetical protein